MTGFRVLARDALPFAPPSWSPEETQRAALWRFPPGGGNRRHREPAERFELPVLFAYGAPAQSSDHVAEKLPDAY